MNDQDVVVKEKDFWVMGLAFLVLALSVATNAVSLIVLSGYAAKANATYQASCSYKRNLEDQVQASTQYLRQHPDGAPSLHLSAAQIQRTISRDQAAIGSLSALACAK